MSEVDNLVMSPLFGEVVELKDNSNNIIKLTPPLFGCFVGLVGEIDGRLGGVCFG